MKIAFKHNARSGVHVLVVEFEQSSQLVQRQVSFENVRPSTTKLDLYDFLNQKDFFAGVPIQEKQILYVLECLLKEKRLTKEDLTVLAGRDFGSTSLGSLPVQDDDQLDIDDLF
jgi:hypothetical protein